MSKKLLARLGLLIVVLFGVTILTFFYTNLSPVDAAEALAVRRYNRPTPQQVELVREELGLDQPIFQQYGSWLWKRRLGGSEHLPVRHHLYVSAKLLDRLHAPARLRSLYSYF